MTQKERRAFGTWSSPISTRMLAANNRFIDVMWSRDGKALVWLESRSGQTVLVTKTEGDSLREITEPDESIRGKVGYGGGEFAVGQDFVIYAGKDGRLMRRSLNGGTARTITPGYGAAASPAVSPDGGWAVYVHHYENDDALLLVDTAGKQLPRRVFGETDFVMQPTWHPEGAYVAFIGWDFPAMPWDNTSVFLAPVTWDDGVPSFGAATAVAGGNDTSCLQPQFSPDGTKLAYVSDEAGWWQLYVLELASGEIVRVTEDAAEYGQPPWVQGQRMFAWADAQTIYALRNENAHNTLRRIDVNTGANEVVGGLEAYAHLRQLSLSPNGKIALLASSSVIPERVVTLDLNTGRAAIQRRSATENQTPDVLSRAQSVTWTDEEGGEVYGLYYPPTSTRFEGIGLPPLIVFVHGGPTSQVRADYHPEAQFYTTRGYAMLYVNHRGGTGYGKAYKDMHRGAWGVWDVKDAASGAAYLAAQGLVDPNKRVIYGGSAGGYTVLQALVDMPGFWTAGVCMYGISNQFTLVSDSEFKFESQYSFTLLGNLPEAAATYRDRSPLFHAEKIVDPVILFQGDEDNVVPQAQSDAIVAALKARGVPYEYHIYAGEGHGWRKPDTIEQFYRTALRFIETYVIYR